MHDPDWPSPKATCPYCGGRQSRVIQTRPSAVYAGGIWRRRVCEYCTQRFSTIEATMPLKRGQRVRAHVAVSV